MTRLEQLIEMGADKFLEMAAQENDLFHEDDKRAFKLGVATTCIDTLIELLKSEQRLSKDYKDFIDFQTEKLRK